MQTPKEVFLELLKPNGSPDHQLKQYEALSMFLGDPCNDYLFVPVEPGGTAINRWGTTIMWPDGAPGLMPHIDDNTKVLKDITRWREYVHAPDIESICTDGWAEAKEASFKQSGDDKLNCLFMSTGIFEQCHYLMGIPDTLTNLYEHPKEMHELIDYITDFRMKYVKMLVENIHPDAILTHDDWGTNDALFMHPDIWREFFKEPYRKFYGYIRSNNIITIHHADSYLVPIIDDMVEIGIQCWQGVLPENNIPELQEKLQGRMILMGGIGASIDRLDSTENEISAYVRNVLETNCPGGHFIPSITYGLPGSVFKHVDPVIDSEIDKYNSILHIPNKRNNYIAKRIRTNSSKVLSSSPGDSSQITGTLSKISAALYKGQKSRVVKLCQEAVAEGIDANSIINTGLMNGMTNLGSDFTKNKVFVPEMLMAAKAMAAATEYLKPLLVSDKSSVIGRACLGTVKGDMHDIGKNLVKIMMEGSGLEVIDLGVDVSAEDFINTAIEKKCDIIACSSLLTTCMTEMKHVVELAIEKGIRDKVKILIGGAPISQSFCDEIGADAYTTDAGVCAKTAVSLICNSNKTS